VSYLAMISADLSKMSLINALGRTLASQSTFPSYSFPFSSCVKRCQYGRCRAKMNDYGENAHDHSHCRHRGEPLACGL
jgi:hypothetical protein